MACAIIFIMNNLKTICLKPKTHRKFFHLIYQVRKRIEETVTRLFKEIPGIRIAVFAHGDYQDKETTYDTKWVDLSTDKKKICNFIKTVSSTCGYDSDECYELVLRQVSGILAWSLSRAFILLTSKLFQI